MTQDGESIDWEHPEIITRTVTRILGETVDWRMHNHSPVGDKATADMNAALRFAGEKADGFQMARFLEDSRLWAADEALVGFLRNTRDWRNQAIRELILERTPKPPVPEGNLKVGFKFKDGTGRVYKIIQVMPSTDGMPYYAVADKDGRRYGATDDLVRKNVMNNGLVMDDSW
jgi:hypothetical protein